MKILKAPCSRNFRRPPSSIHPPPLKGYLQGWGVGVYKVWPCIIPCPPQGPGREKHCRRSTPVLALKTGGVGVSETLSRTCF